jgi:selT/selW/selH-like putative selenoprotein
MEISVKYCGTCNYRPIAASLAMAIEKETGLKPLLVHSKAMGALEVRINEELIFPKMKTGQFPDTSTFVEILKSRK